MSNLSHIQDTNDWSISKQLHTQMFQSTGNTYTQPSPSRFATNQQTTPTLTHRIPTKQSFTSTNSSLKINPKIKKISRTYVGSTKYQSAISNVKTEAISDSKVDMEEIFEQNHIL